MEIILASNSARRKQLLSQCCPDFRIVPSNSSEKLDNLIFNSEKIENLALNKALSVNDYKNIIIGADTVVVFDGKIFNKPKNFDEAFDMLSKLSGNTHFVQTSVAVLFKDIRLVRSVVTNVTFNELSSDCIKEYIQKFQPYDKAGAYGIQELPEGFVKSVDGDFDNVVGLPVATVKNMLDEMTKKILSTE